VIVGWTDLAALSSVLRKWRKRNSTKIKYSENT
jgi:hypothetical protein